MPRNRVETMQPVTDGVAATRLGRILAWCSAGRVPVMLYYLAVMVGLLLLYARGETATPGFIYQAF